MSIYSKKHRYYYPEIISNDKLMVTQYKSLYFLIILSLILAACQATGTQVPVVETLVVTEVEKAAPVETIQVVTPTPGLDRQRTLVICVREDPATLYRFRSTSLIEAHIFNAIADGGWNGFDTNSFAYQPVILEKLPNLADGDASLISVTVSEGDMVVDANGDVISLDSSADPPPMLVPAGGGDPVAYQGGEFKMEQLSATFKLLPGLLWSDGESLTAADSVYAFDLQADPDTQAEKDKIERTAAYTAIDELTSVWTGLPGYLDADYRTNFFGPAPEHVWGHYTAAELIKAEESHLKPIGWGPYMVGEWIQGDSITLQKNPNYFRADEGLPRFDTLIFRFVGENTNDNIAALLSGECDILDITAGIGDQNELLLDLQSSSKIKATFTTGTVWEHLDFGIQHIDYDDGYQPGIDRPDFFSDVRTRQAFLMCMDRQSVVDSLTFRQSKVLDSYLPPQHPLYNPDVRHYEFDVAAGSALLEEIGWMDNDGDPGTPRIAQEVANVPDGTRLSINYETTSSRSGIATILQGSFAQCGIQVNIQTYSTSELFADGPEGAIFGRQFDLGGFAWLTGVEPPCDIFVSSDSLGPAGDDWISVQDGRIRTFNESGWLGDNSNNPGFANEEYDQVCNTALGSLPGQLEYETAHLEAQRIFAEQLPVAPLHLSTKLSATRPDLCGLIMDPTTNSSYWNIEEFDYGEGCDR